MNALAATTETNPRLRSGTAGLRRANQALFAGGFATFALLYCVQPLLPTLSTVFGVDPATSSLALSLSTGTMAVAMLVVSSAADAVGRKRVMGWSLTLASGLGLAAAAAPTWTSLLVLRLLMGVALAGLPAVAMAYLAEEVEGESLGVAMGLYISGNAAGGLAGRLIAGVLADFFSWRVALGGIGLASAVATALFWRSLPVSRHFHPRPLETGALLRSLGRHLREPGLQKLFAMGFVLMGCFVTVYNYIGYRVMAPPYGLSQRALAALFTVNLVGVFTSTWAGRLTGRLGRRRVLWWMPAVMLAGMAVTLLAPLPVIVVGLVVVAAGFFAGHSVASSWVGRRADEARAQASGLYLFFYYMGGSIIGWLGGHAWTAWRWPGVAGLVGAVALAGVGLAWNMRTMSRLHPATVPETEPAEPAG
ncbi:MAG: MFS transporter [Opitutaceae bacterium]|jgi:YNFM family putative membrane transporter